MKVCFFHDKYLGFSVYPVKGWLFLSRRPVFNYRIFCVAISWFFGGFSRVFPPQPPGMGGPAEASHSLLSTSLFWVAHPTALPIEVPFPTGVHFEESARRSNPQAPSWGPLHLRETPPSFQWKGSHPHFLSQVHWLSPTPFSTTSTIGPRV